MNVYDFDKTIYKHDSSIDFYFFELSKNHRILMYLPKQLFYLFLHLIRLVDTKSFKEKFFSFLKEIEDIELEVISFWNAKEQNVEEWYIKQKRDDDIIISASPKFLLDEICKRLNVRLIATNMDKKTGEIFGNNCKGEEKVKVFKAQYPNEKIDSFFSDSISDKPLAMCADKAFLVKKSSFKKWDL